MALLLAGKFSIQDPAYTKFWTIDASSATEPDAFNTRMSALLREGFPAEYVGFWLVWKARIASRSRKIEGSALIQVSNNLPNEILEIFRECNGQRILEIGASSVYFAVMLAICGANVVCQDMAENFRRQALLDLKNIWEMAKAQGIPANGWLTWISRIKLVQGEYSGLVASPAFPQPMIPPTYNTIILTYVLSYQSALHAQAILARAAGELLPNGKLVLAAEQPLSSQQQTEVLEVFNVTTILEATDLPKMYTVNIPGNWSTLFGYSISVDQKEIFGRSLTSGTPAAEHLSLPLTPAQTAFLKKLIPKKRTGKKPYAVVMGVSLFPHSYLERLLKSFSLVLDNYRSVTQAETTHYLSEYFLAVARKQAA